jgi:2-dehydro-3-deoxyphosphogalactonate aldolase
MLPTDTAPIIAILRGVRPDEIVEIAQALYDNGVRTIEVPLSSPDALSSIALLAAVFGERCLCGAGTVLSAADVNAVYSVGGKLIVTPNTDPAVIERSIALNLRVVPGFATPTEAFRAIQAGARTLKLFPASTYGPAHLKAIRDVLPGDVKVFAVGGLGASNLKPWFDAGVDGVGAGGDIYRPGFKPEEVAKRARSLVSAWREQAAQ